MAAAKQSTQGTQTTKARAATGKPAGPLPAVVILHGSDRSVQLRHTADLRAALEAVHGQLEPLLLEGDQARPADVLDECRSRSLMQSFKLVIVDKADALVKGGDEADGAAPARGATRSGRELMESYAAAPDDGACLILRAERWYPGKLDKLVAEHGGQVIKCEPPTAAQALAAARANAEAMGQAVEPGALEALVQAVGPDLGRLEMELHKLAMVKPGEPISAATVAAMVGLTREEEFWQIGPTLLAGSAPAALKHLHELLELSRQDPIPIMFTYIDLARKLHGVSRGLAARENPRSLMGQYRLWGPVADGVMKLASRVNPQAAGELLDATMRAAVRQRSGSEDPVHVLEELTVRFAGIGSA